MPSILSGHVLIQRVTAKNAIAKRFGQAPSGLGHRNMEELSAAKKGPFLIAGSTCG
jgi:hypothetical protein